MPARNYSSTAEGKTLSTGINNVETTIVLNSISTLPSAYPYTLVIDADSASEEIVTVVESAGGTSLTVVRGQDTTTAIAHDPGAVIKHMITPRDLREPQSHIEASSAYEIKNNGQDPAVTTANITKTVHGIGTSEGSVVGTAKSQTLTNKTISLSNNTVTGTTAEFNTALTDGNFATVAFVQETLPAGSIIASAATSTPTGWLLCDGSAVSRTTYSSLFSAISTTYGSGNGTTTFNLPNLKGRIIVGLDASQTEFDTLGETGGSKAHTHTNSSTGTAGAHTHAIDPPSTSTSSDAHSHTAPSHTHTGPAHTHALTSHDHTGPSHTHTGPSHTHTTNPPTTTTSSAGSHDHTSTIVASGNGLYVMDDTSDGSHTHTVSIGDITSSAAGTGATGAGGTGATGSGLFNATSPAGGAADTAFDITESSGTGNTGSSGDSATTSDAHSHTVDIVSFTSGAVSVEHQHTMSDTGSTSNLSPYIVLNYLIKH
jgi:microcystin-dependent protein